MAQPRQIGQRRPCHLSRRTHGESARTHGEPAERVLLRRREQLPGVQENGLHAALA